MKDGRIDYPFKEKHQQELAEFEEKAKERLIGNIKDEFERTISILKQENGMLKNNIDQTNEVYREHLIRMKSELAVEKSMFLKSVEEKTELLNQTHKEQIKEMDKKHREQVAEKETEIQKLIAKIKNMSGNPENYVEPLEFNGGENGLMTTRKIERLCAAIVQAEKTMKRNFLENKKTYEKMMNRTIGKEDVSFISIEKEVKVILERYENQWLDEWLCNKILNEIGQVKAKVVLMDWRKREADYLFSFNARKITVFFSNSLSLLRFLEVECK